MAENVFKDRALQSYLNQISNIEPLSREEENELAIKAQKGDKKALDKLVTSNLKFVVKVAARYQNRGLSLAELISEGNMGLIKAIEKFDPEKDNKLISYAVWWIRQRILFALAEKTNVIRMPLGKSNMMNKIKFIDDQVYSETGRHASVEEIADRSNLDKKAIKKVNKQAVKTTSLDDKNYTNKHDSVTLSEFLEDPDDVDPKTLYYRERVQDKIEDSISKLPPRDAFIVKQYFGLDGDKGKNFAQIGEELGLSRERVRQIQKAALQKIMADAYEEMEKDIDYLLNY
ncbi:MAG: RNA polymerase sigma factor RpoD/SigA [Candidatus Cloacimonetes bacterium]|nr:RNA polymerase sigma factor RpoD/SigA [Candidatus Cloacimonadota bacterium]MCF7813827.1 RNA polymerase sigma factor RpoD/SigA [Candidatus Cloacimonadota bacterium]MCF7868265.1 RNA polymerase sigma factor RpoD/SigA [Candidatus Cloacimonadota bacterium]MCF7883761.1 RNA polymerase sigma factor RpoD/SigA [Candidatus Cloacimonadota bacterium]